MKTWSDVCVDLDHDGFGFQCSAGDDCDDTNSEVHDGCGLCSPAESEGCACSNRGETTSCVASRSVTDAGALACEVGTRTCRDGAWSACEQLTVKEAAPESLLRYRAIIDLDASPRSCDPCHPNCYRVDDPLAETDGSVGEFVVSTAGGGVTLYAALEDGGVPVVVTPVGDACVPGIAPDSDCDGIPDVFDPYPSTPPFASTHQTIFLDLEPGKTKSSDIDIRFNLNTADIYLYVDMTGSMDGERTNLLNSFRTGNYLPDAAWVWTAPTAIRTAAWQTKNRSKLRASSATWRASCAIAGWVPAGTVTFPSASSTPRVLRTGQTTSSSIRTKSTLPATCKPSRTASAASTRAAVSIVPRAASWACT